MTDPNVAPASRWAKVWEVIVHDVGTIPAVIALIASHWKTFLGVFIVGLVVGIWFGHWVL